MIVKEIGLGLGSLYAVLEKKVSTPCKAGCFTATLFLEPSLATCLFAIYATGYLIHSCARRQKSIEQPNTPPQNIQPKEPEKKEPQPQAPEIPFVDERSLNLPPYEEPVSELGDM